MTLIGWIVFTVFLVWVVWDGVRHSAASNSLDEYYAGGRRIPWWAAGLSVMATQASAITVIGTTGQGHDGGLSFVQFYFGLPFAMIVLCLFFVPVYRRLPILTVYEYLEQRFNPATRAFASLVFLASRCLALGIVITAPAVVMSALLELPLETTIIAVGALTTFYTVFGGVSAVVWTDVKQMSVILAGIFISFIWLAVDVLSELGLGGALRAAGAAGKLDALIVVPPTDLVPRPAEATAGSPSFWESPYTLWSGLIGGFFLQLSYFGCDQSQVQRILTNPTANDSRKALLMSAFAKVPMQFFVLGIGVLLWLSHGLHGEPMLYKPDDRARAAQADPALLAGFEARHAAAVDERREAIRTLVAHPDDPRSDRALMASYRGAVAAVDQVRSEAASTFSASGKREDTNYVFPQWFLTELPGVLVGLIVAAVFAAAMSSVDSVLNSLSAATVVDFYRRWLRPTASERESVVAGRATTFLWGVVATGTAIMLISGSSFIEQVNKIGSFFYGSLLGVFVLGLFFSRVGGYAGFVGLACGMVSVGAVHLTWKVEFLWYNVVGLVGALAGGLVWHWIAPRATQRWQPLQ